MANNFTFGGDQDVTVHRALLADDRWIPNAAALVSDLAGRTDPTQVGPIAVEMAGVGATNGFFMESDVPVLILFHGLVAATVELQVYIPIFTGGAAWKTVVSSAEWLAKPSQVIQSPLGIWRVGCVTLSTDTLFITAMFGRDRC